MPTSGAGPPWQEMSAHQPKCRHFAPSRRPARYLGQHPQDVLLDPPDLSLDLLQRARRRVAVEVAVEVDLVTDEADLAVFGVALGCVEPGVGDVRPDLAIEECLDALGQRHALR